MLKFNFRKWIVLALLPVMLLPLFVQPAQAGTLDQTYSYVYDSYGKAVENPVPYQTKYRIDVSSFGIGTVKLACSLFVVGDDLYICDQANNRFVQVTLKENEAEFVRVIEGTADGSEEGKLKNPTDIYVTEDGTMIIADQGNNRILILDKDMNKVCEVLRPEDPSVDQTVPFQPNKLVVASGHIYAQVKSINRGLMEFTLDGEFVGFVGASPVKFNWEDYIWKMIATDEQRASMISFVPTEYNNIAVDSEGFLFVTNSVFTPQELQSGQAQPIRRLNLKGSNILIENGNSTVIGDTSWNADGPSRFTDITVLDNGTYYALDTMRCRVFAYDNQGNMLYAFGGIGTKSGYFTSPTSIEHHGNDLLVLDSSNGLVTVMGHTQFGALVGNAIDTYSKGQYNESKAYWEQVLQYNGSYELAYRGIGKVLLRNGEYEEALDYLQYAKDEFYYSKAWKLYRKAWIEENIIWIISIIGAAIVIALIVTFAKKIIGKVENYELWHESIDP